MTQNKNPIFPAVISNSPGNIILFFFLLYCTVSSCTSTKNSTYFQNLQKDTTLKNLVSKSPEPTIKKNDLLGIVVASLSPDVAFYNASQNSGGVTAQATTAAVPGYLVDENGNIPFVKIGVLHVEGMTRKELKDTLEKSLVPYLREAVVSIAFLNRHITMLGGISPQVIPLASDNMTILDALALGGDIVDKGRADNILVIREKGDNKEFKRLTLMDNSIFYSPFFYMQPNDIVYVEPFKKKISKTPQIVSYITASISLVILILNQLLK